MISDTPGHPVLRLGNLLVKAGSFMTELGVEQQQHCGGGDDVSNVSPKLQPAVGILCQRATVLLPILDPHCPCRNGKFGVVVPCQTPEQSAEALHSPPNGI